MKRELTLAELLGLPNAGMFDDVEQEQEQEQARPVKRMPTGEQLRDEGIALVRSNSRLFSNEAGALLRRWIAAQGSRTFTADEFKAWAEPRITCPPSHVNAWSALWSGLTSLAPRGRGKGRAGIVEVVRYEKARTASRHACVTPVYRAVRRDEGTS